MEKITVVKVGGKIVEDEQSLNQLLTDFNKIEGNKILVHGGGRSATKLAERLGVETKMVEGRRITDDAMLEVVTMVYGGLVNKRIVAALQVRGVNALGMTGADMNILLSDKRPVKTVDYGWVGDVKQANGGALAKLINEGVVPVIAPLTHDGMGHILNTNADTMAATVAKALTEEFDVTLTYCFEKPGVMADAEDDDSVIPSINTESYARLKADGIVSGGMIPKLDNAFDSISSGVKRVVITHFMDIQASMGTVIEK